MVTSRGFWVIPVFPGNGQITILHSRASVSLYAKGNYVPVNQSSKRKNLIRREFGKG